MEGAQIIQALEQAIIQRGFNLVQDRQDADSHYYELKLDGKLVMMVIRVSNHCSNLTNWENHYSSNNPSLHLSNKELRRYRGNYKGLNDKYFTKQFYSYVIFDPEKDGEQTCGDIQGDKIFVKQKVFDATQMTAQDLGLLQNEITEIVNNNNIITENTMKKKVKLTESKLRQIIKECLNEAYLDNSWGVESDGFWNMTPQQIHTALLKMGYCIGMPTERVMAIIHWARAMFFLPLDIPEPTKEHVLNIIIAALKGSRCKLRWGDADWELPDLNGPEFEGREYRKQQNGLEQPRLDQNAY